MELCQAMWLEECTWLIHTDGWQMKENRVALLCREGHFAGKMLFASPAERLTANPCKVLLTDRLHPKRKHFYSNGTDLFQDERTLIHRAWGLTECFDEDEKYLNHMLWPSQWPEPNWSGFWIIVDHWTTKWISFGRVVFVHPVQFQKPSESTPRCILIAHGGQKSY